MESIETLKEPRLRLPDKKEFNPAEYAKKVFGMFSGETERVSLQFDNSLIGVVLDRFGKEITVFKADERGFVVHVDAIFSPALLGWIFSFGDKVKVLGPEA